MTHSVTCIVCPMGCRMKVTKLTEGYRVEGNSCKRGEKYGVEELTDPRRVITTTVKLKNSYLNLLPVKTKDSVPKGIMFDIMELLDDIIITAPVKVGDIIVENVLGTGIDIVSTKTMEVV